MTGVVPEPPEVSISAANAVADMANTMQSARQSAVSFGKCFFIEYLFLPFGYKNDGFAYAAVSHSMTNTTVAIVAEVTGLDSGVTMAL